MRRSPSAAAVALEEARTVFAPPDELRDAIEAICTPSRCVPTSTMRSRGYFKNGDAFIEKLLAFNAVNLPPMARSRCMNFLSSAEPTPPPDDDALRVLAVTLRTWVVAVFAREAAEQAKEAAVEKAAISRELTSVVEALSDVFQIVMPGQASDGEGRCDLQGALMLAAAFPTDDPAATEHKELDALEEKRQKVLRNAEDYRRYEKSWGDAATQSVRELKTKNHWLRDFGLEENGAPIITDMLVLEADNVDAPWHVAGRLIFAAVLLLVSRAEVTRK